MKKLERLWNWKKYPESVFLLVIPLAAIGLSSMFLKAVLMLAQGDPWYLVIFVTIGGLGMVSLYQLHQNYARLKNDK